MTYDKSRGWADQFTPELQRMLMPVVGPTNVATPFEDRRMATDLKTWSTRGGPATRIALRVRDADRYPPAVYRKEFTIRGGLSSGGSTEFDKIMAGRVDLMMYAFGKEGVILEAQLFDMDMFRGRVEEYRENEVPNPWRVHRNNDGRSLLYLFSIPTMFPNGEGIKHTWTTKQPKRGLR